MTNSKYGKILAIATSVCAVLLGISFIICCAHLYFTGSEAPYSRDRVGDYLIWLIVPSVITLLLAVGGLIYNAITGQKEDNNTPRTSGEMLEGFLKRFDFESFDDETKNEINAIRKRRNIIDFIASELSALCFVFILDYFLFIADFSVENLSADIMAAFAVVLPIAAIGIAVHIPRAFVAEKSAEKELALLKESVKAGGAAKVIASEKKAEERVNYTAVARYVIAGAAVVLIILGIANGGMADVLQKAVKICTECIGLG